MQNTLLVGLSRQMVLERQLDVISNNIANVNTNGFKADKSLFEEFLGSGAHEDNFKGTDRRVTYVQDRGTFRDFSQGGLQQTGNPLDVAIAGNGFMVVQAQGGERYTRDGNLQINPQGQLVTPGGNPVLGTAARSCSSRPTTTSSSPPTAPSRCRKARRARIRSAASFASSASPTRRSSSSRATTSTPATARAQDVKSTIQQGFVEKSNVNSVMEMSHMVEVMRTYTNIANILQQQSDMHKNAIDKLADVPA